MHPLVACVAGLFVGCLMGSMTTWLLMREGRE